MKPWRKEQWVIPPEHNGEFVAQMEQVLDVYKRPYDPQRPVVCMDESPRQLIGETKVPVPARPGCVARHDYEYERCGVCNVFMAVEPLAGKRLVRVTERKTKTDWAFFGGDCRAIPRGAEDHAGHGQSERARTGVALRDVCPGDSQGALRSLRVRLRAQARQLAEYGRD